MMKRSFQRAGWGGALSVAVVLFTASIAVAGMNILLKDGKVLSVPVNKEDVVGITFEEKAPPAAPAAPAAAAAPSAPAVPAAKSVNITWDFETGDLRGWHATGTAFNNQPTYGDNPTARHRGQPSRHQGNYWIGGYENRHTQSDPAGRIQGEAPQGTLTSEPFTITSKLVSFLIGGGCDIKTERIELVVDGHVAHRATGKCTETMERVKWDLREFRNRTAQLRLVDSSSGGWGHINFDDVRFE